MKKDQEKTVQRYREAAEQGDAEAQYNLGKCYDNGDGVKEDKKEAAKWYRKAAEQGDAEAQYNLGCCYDNGDGVKEDKSGIARRRSRGMSKRSTILASATMSAKG